MHDHMLARGTIKPTSARGTATQATEDKGDCYYCFSFQRGQADG